MASDLGLHCFQEGRLNTKRQASIGFKQKLHRKKEKQQKRLHIQYEIGKDVGEGGGVRLT